MINSDIILYLNYNIKQILVQLISVAFHNSLSYGLLIKITNPSLFRPIKYFESFFQSF